MVNNRDGQTQWQKEKASLTVTKNQAGMKLFHGGSGSFSYPVYGFLHDAYHPEPNQLGEGKSGDALVFRFTEGQKLTTRTVVHAIALDEPSLLENWQFEQNESDFILKSNTRKWTLKLNENNGFSVISGHGRTWDIVNEKFVLKRIQ